MTNKKNWLIILALVLVFGLTVVGCGDDNGNDGAGGGSETGTVIFKNTAPVELRDIRITRNGEQVGYYAGPLKTNISRNFSKMPTGLLNISFEHPTGTQRPSHNFTVSNGETVNINYTQYANFVITRSSGSDDPVVTDTGSLRIYNSSNYTINSVSISQNGKVVKSDSASFASPGNKLFTGIPVGSCDVLVSREAGYRFYRWEGTVTINKDSTASLNIPATGWN